jgi:hypothetical protein
VQVDDGGDGHATVRSSFVVHELRKTQGGEGEPRSFPGRYEHHLRREDGAWKIATKKVWLLGRDLPVFNLTFIL